MKDEILKIFGVSQKNYLTLKSKTLNRIIPLTYTEVTASMYFHWKKQGLITWGEELKDAKRSRVKLNLIEAAWVRLLLKLRQFGISVEQMKIIHKELLTKDEDFILEHLKNAFNEIKKVTENDELRDFLENMKEEEYNEILDDEQVICFTDFGVLISRLMLEGLGTDLLIYYDKSIQEIKIDYYFYEESKKSKQGAYILISLKELIAEIIEDDKYEKSLIEFEIFNEKETTILEALRKNNVKEIVLTKLNNEEYKITVVENQDIIGDDVKHLKRAFGLDNYNKVTIINRNNKHAVLEKTKTNTLKF